MNQTGVEHVNATDAWMCVQIQCIIWNVADESAVRRISVHHDTIYCVSWNHVGSAFATTCKDKMIRVIDAHSGLIVAVSIYIYIYIYITVITWTYIRLLAEFEGELVSAALPSIIC